VNAILDELRVHADDVPKPDPPGRRIKREGKRGGERARVSE
jgi:hypothetical protein